MSYAFPPGGLPGQDEQPDLRACFRTAYAVIPANTMRDIVTSRLPGWRDSRAWILARPLSGFAETFAQYALEVAPGGGSDLPEPDPEGEGVLFVARGAGRLRLEGEDFELGPGSYAFLAPAARWSLWNRADEPLCLHWIRRRHVAVPGLGRPESFVTADAEVTPEPMPGSSGRWATSRFVDPEDLRHDFHVNIVTFQPGGRIPFAETHVMEHGIYVLEGHARYLLDTDWHDVGPGDFMWLRAFCPQACVATGDGPFRYLLYKDVNRHPPLSP